MAGDINCIGDHGRYEIKRELGAGAMGRVHLAFDHRLQREVVVKLLAPQFATNPTVRQRFLTEALIQANLIHPAIIRALDVIQDGHVLGIVMDVVRGPNLHAYVAGLPIRPGPEEMLRLMMPVVEAVQHAHDNGVVHRDIKPANIMVDLSRGEPVAKVVDFGIAKVLGDAARHHTREGSVLGTPAFMPPEQLRGAADVDHRADIYGLGAVLYWLGGGRLPFEGGSEYEITARVLAGERPPPPSSFDSRFDARFDDVISSAMAPDRTERFQSCNALATALRHALGPPEPSQAGAGQVTSASSQQPTRYEEPAASSVSTATNPAITPLGSSHRRGVGVVVAVGAVALIAAMVAFVRSSDEPAGPNAPGTATAALVPEQNDRSSSRVEPSAAEPRSLAGHAATGPDAPPHAQPPETPRGASMVTAPTVPSTPPPPALSAAPSTWWCICYRERLQGRAEPCTACRQSLSQCQDLEQSIYEGRSKVMIPRSLFRSCQAVSSEHPGDSLGGRGIWKPSAFPGAWWVPGQCVLP